MEALQIPEPPADMVVQNLAGRLADAEAALARASAVIMVQALENQALRKEVDGGDADVPDPRS